MNTHSETKSQLLNDSEKHSTIIPLEVSTLTQAK
jgi:hypothetical protein